MTSASFFLPAFVASFTFYLAGQPDDGLTSPAGPEDNPANSVYLDPSETQFSGMEPDDEPGTLTVSAVAPDGFDLSWDLTAPGVYDSLTVECTDVEGLWDAREVPLPGDAAGASVRGLRALTEYRIKLYGVIRNQRSALLEAAAVTGRRVFILEVGMHDTHFYFSLTQTVAVTFFYISYKKRNSTKKWFREANYYLLHLFQLLLMILCIPKRHFRPFFASSPSPAAPPRSGLRSPPACRFNPSRSS